MHRPPARPLPARPSAPQGSQCSISRFVASLGAQEDWYCTHIAHQCCDQLTAVKTGYPLTSITWPFCGLRSRPIEVEYLFEVIRWQVTSFQMIAGSSLIFFLIDIQDVVFYMCRTIKILISNWPKKLNSVFTDREDMPVAIDFSQGHALVALYVQVLCSDWSKLDRWVLQHLETCLLWHLKLTEFNFVSTCDVFKCLFPLNVQNEIQLLSRVFCYSWLVCLLGCWLRNTSLVIVGNPISVFFFTLLDA